MEGKKDFEGCLNLIIGPMYSGKTSTLITRYNRHNIARRKCIMIKYKNDTRYDEKMIVTHNGIKVEAIPCEELADVDSIVQKYDVVCVDEVQFYKDAHIFCDKWANNGLIVEACGLNGTFERKPFNVVNLLIPKCNDLLFLTAICRETRQEAVYSKRNTDDKEEEVIGGADIYSAADRKMFFKDMGDSWRNDCLLEYAEVFCQKRNIELTDSLKDKIKNLHVNENTNYKQLLVRLTSNSLQYANVEDKRVILRADLNVPVIDGEIISTNRIDSVLPTLKFILDQHPKQVIIISHLGRPKARNNINDRDSEFSLNPVREYIANKLGFHIKLWQDLYTEVPSSEEYPLVMLENIRYYQGESSLDPEFCNRLTNLCDVYVNDAFGCCHRNHSSIVGVNAPEKYMGFLVEKEVKYLSKVFHLPGRKVAVIGGAKVNDKIKLIYNLLDNVNALIVGGAMAFTFLKHTCNMDIGDSIFDKEGFELIPKILTKAIKNKVNIYLPIDFVCGKDVSEMSDTMECTAQSGIPEGWMGLDIGPNSTDYFNAILNDADIVVWNGPLGVFEIEQFSHGTRNVMKNLAEMNITKVIGGGDTTSCCEKFGYKHYFTHVSTGGGASLKLLEGGSLPGIEILK